jgi:hypothetical protein
MSGRSNISGFIVHCIRAERDGRVGEILVGPGAQVDAKDLPLVFEHSAPGPMAVSARDENRPE